MLRYWFTQLQTQNYVILATDASSIAIGGVDHQFGNNNCKLLDFFSKRLSDTESCYPMYDRELLAIYRSIKYFKRLLDGRDFEVYSNHKPISFAFTKFCEKIIPCRAAQLSYINEFTTTIRHVSGKNNVVPDLLSRIDSIELRHINFEEMAIEQENDKSLN